MYKLHVRHEEGRLHAERRRDRQSGRKIIDRLQVRDEEGQGACRKKKRQAARRKER
jgi:hypothetical protein